MRIWNKDNPSAKISDEAWEDEDEQQMSIYDEPQSRTGRILGKSVYAVLAICLLAVAGVAAATWADNAELAVTDTESSTTAITAASRQTTTVTEVKTTTAAMQEAAATAAASTESEETTTVKTTLFIRPFGNHVLTAFSHEPLFNATMGDYRVHLGTDYAGDRGDTVKALADGTVNAVLKDTLWGYVIELDHENGIISRYCGVKSDLAVGDAVALGDEIGTLDEIPCEADSQPHLHLELFQNGEAVDPTSLLGGQVES